MTYVFQHLQVCKKTQFNSLLFREKWFYFLVDNFNRSTRYLYETNQIHDGEITKEFLRNPHYWSSLDQNVRHLSSYIHP